MALDVKISYSWTNYCRLCLLDNGIMIPIFEGEGMNRQLGRKIETSLQLLTYDGDPLPRMICHKCLYKLNQAFDFRTMALASYERLKVHLLPLKHVTAVQQYLEKSERIRSSTPDVSDGESSPVASTPEPNRVEVSGPKTSGLNPPQPSRPRIRIKSDAELRGAQPSLSISPILQSPIPAAHIPLLESTRIASPKNSVAQVSTSTSSFIVPISNSLCRPLFSHPSNSETGPPSFRPLCASPERTARQFVPELMQTDQNEPTLNASQKFISESSDDGGRHINPRFVPPVPKKRRRKSLAGPASLKPVDYPTSWQCLLCFSFFLSRRSLSLHMDVCLKCNSCSQELGSVKEKAEHEAVRHIRVLADAEKKHLQKRCSRCPSRFASSVMLASHVKYDHKLQYSGRLEEEIPPIVHDALPSDCWQKSDCLPSSSKQTSVAGSTEPDDRPEQSSADSEVASDLGDDDDNENHLDAEGRTERSEDEDSSETPRVSVSPFWKKVQPKFSKVHSVSCPKCDRKLPNKASLAHHLQFHDKLNYKCSICSSVFPTGSKLRLHEKTEHGKSTAVSYRCKVCRESFESRSILILHKQSHKKAKNICSNVINESSSAVQAEEMKIKKYSCHRCTEQFSDDDVFVSHLYQHACHASENDKSKANDALVVKDKYQINDLVVEKEKVNCNENEEGDTIDEIGIKCDRCNVICRSKEYFTLHMARHMSKTKSHFPCIGCKHTFKNIEALNRHTCLGKEAKERASCLDCGQALPPNETHVCDNKCQKCGKVFKSSRGQRLHSLYKHAEGLPPGEDAFSSQMNEDEEEVRNVMHNVSMPISVGNNTFKRENKTSDEESEDVIQNKPETPVAERIFERSPPDGAPGGRDGPMMSNMSHPGLITNPTKAISQLVLSRDVVSDQWEKSGSTTVMIHPPQNPCVPEYVPRVGSVITSTSSSSSVVAINISNSTSTASAPTLML